MRQLAILVLLAAAPSCGWFTMDARPLAEQTELRRQVDAEFVAGWRGLLNHPKTQIDAGVRAAVEAKIEQFDERSKKFTTTMLDFAAKVGTVDWRKLYEQIREAVKR